jgi:hypothetical protein
MPEARDSGDGLSPLCEGNPLARELARLVPAPPGFERDALLFAAGSAARAATVARWRWATAAAVCIAAGAWGYSLLEPGQAARSSGRTSRTGTETDPAVIPKPVPVPVPAPAAGSTEAAASPLVVKFVEEADPGERVKGLRIRNDILTAGLGMIPSAARPEATAQTSWKELEQLLGLPAGSFAVPMWEKEKPKSDDQD